MDDRGKFSCPAANVLGSGCQEQIKLVAGDIGWWGRWRAWRQCSPLLCISSPLSASLSYQYPVIGKRGSMAVAITSHSACCANYQTS